MLDDLVTFWRNMLLELEINYKDEVRNLILKNEPNNIMNWNDFYNQSKKEDINHFTFDRIYNINLDNGLVFRESDDTELQLSNDQLFIEITMDFSKHYFFPKTGEPLEYSNSIILPRTSAWIYSYGQNNKSKALFDFKIIGSDYDNDEDVKFYNRSKFELDDQKIFDLFNINIMLRRSIIEFNQEGREIYNRETRPKNFIDAIRYSLKTSYDASTDGFVKNKYRKKSVCLDFMELDLIIEIYDALNGF